MPSDLPDPDNLFTSADVIYAYTRAMALSDGSLRDLTDEAKEAGIRYPVAITALAYQEAISMTDAAYRMGCDEGGRRWDVVWMLRNAMRQTQPGVDTLTFNVLVVCDRRAPDVVELKAVVGPGDKGEPVVTVMMPDED